MYDLFKKIREQALIRALIFLVLGILIIIFPDPIMRIIVYILGALFIVMGVINLITYFSNRSHSRGEASDFTFILGILYILIGIILLVFYKQILLILPVVLGILLILDATLYFLESINLSKVSSGTGIPLLVYSIIMVIVGIIFMFNPFGSLSFLLRVFGVILICIAVFDVYVYFYLRPKK